MTLGTVYKFGNEEIPKGLFWDLATVDAVSKMNKMTVNFVSIANVSSVAPQNSGYA